MITGVIAEGLKPELSLIVRGPSGIEHSVNARIDTGFDDYVLLPQSVVDELQLPFLMRTPIDLADGSQRYLNYHGATVLWNGQERKLPVLATPSENALIWDGPSRKP